MTSMSDPDIVVVREPTNTVIVTSPGPQGSSGVGLGRKSWLGPAGAGTTITQAHGYSHSQVVVQVRIAATGEDITNGVDVLVDGTNIIVTFASSQSDRSVYRIIANG